jgi:hypothetical protein
MAMKVASPYCAQRPKDAGAFDAARAEFWMRWCGELPSYVEARRQKALNDRASHEEGRNDAEQSPRAAVRSPPGFFAIHLGASSSCEIPKTTANLAAIYASSLRISHVPARPWPDGQYWSHTTDCFFVKESNASPRAIVARMTSLLTPPVATSTSLQKYASGIGWRGVLSRFVNRRLSQINFVDLKRFKCSVNRFGS